MGARTQVYIKDTKVYLYSHYDSFEIETIVAKALSKRWRWDDPEYLARIIFDAMIGDSFGEETGYGIGTQQHGDIDNLVTIDCEEQTVQYQIPTMNKTIKKYTFESFIKKYA